MEASMGQWHIKKNQDNKTNQPTLNFKNNKTNRLQQQQEKKTQNYYKT